jgi:NADPH:quinone reductase-like Zn-dependent oxidoreductase
MREHVEANIYLLQSCTSKQILRRVLLTLKLKSTKYWDSSLPRPSTRNWRSPPVWLGSWDFLFSAIFCLRRQSIRSGEGTGEIALASPFAIFDLVTPSGRTPYRIEEEFERQMGMHAAVLHEIGTTPRYEEFPEPVSCEGEAIVHVHAASLKPVDKQLASGSHYASRRQLPCVCGSDGVGQLDDGKRVFFGGPRPPHGAMAQRTVVPRAFTFPIPENVNDETAAALPNPGVSAWLSLVYRAKLVRGENVLILGATGVTGKLAVKIAKLLGAGRVVAAGRNEQELGKLLEGGADAIISLALDETELRAAFLRELGHSGFQVVLDYVWGRPAEAFLAAITRREFSVIQSETRFVQVGESAAPTITLPAAVLRSTALTILGTAGIPTRDVLVEAFQQVMAYAVKGDLQIETDRVPLADIENAWQRDQPGRRVVIMTRERV